jgi:hypothetical protein
MLAVGAPLTASEAREIANARQTLAAFFKQLVAAQAPPFRCQSAKAPTEATAVWYVTQLTNNMLAALHACITPSVPDTVEVPVGAAGSDDIDGGAADFYDEEDAVDEDAPWRDVELLQKIRLRTYTRNSYMAIVPQSCLRAGVTAEDRRKILRIAATVLKLIPARGYFYAKQYIWLLVVYGLDPVADFRTIPDFVDVAWTQRDARDNGIYMLPAAKMALDTLVRLYGKLGGKALLAPASPGITFADTAQYRDFDWRDDVLEVGKTPTMAGDVTPVDREHKTLPDFIRYTDRARDHKSIMYAREFAEPYEEGTGTRELLAPVRTRFSRDA